MSDERAALSAYLIPPARVRLRSAGPARTEALAARLRAFPIDQTHEKTRSVDASEKVVIAPLLGEIGPAVVADAPELIALGFDLRETDDAAYDRGGRARVHAGRDRPASRAGAAGRRTPGVDTPGVGRVA